MTLRKSFQTALVAFFFVAFQSGLFAQDELKQWHTKDAADGFYGVSSEKALELLKGRKSSKVRVAIIDSGVDVDHEDLKKNIWVNPKEIAGNGKDDDGNGYVDDINGWNFMGNSKGVNLEHANLEMTRIYRKLAPRFAEVKDAKSSCERRQSRLCTFSRSEQEGKCQIGRSKWSIWTIKRFCTHV
jgi:hypothetical protein